VVYFLLGCRRWFARDDPTQGHQLRCLKQAEAIHLRNVSLLYAHCLDLLTVKVRVSTALPALPMLGKIFFVSGLMSSSAM